VSEGKNINWNSVLTNALSALVATIFVGAAAIVWNAATTIDDKVKKATDSIIDTQTGLTAAQQTTAGEIADLKAEIRKLQAQISSLSKVVRNPKVAGSAKSLSAYPLVLKEFKIDPKKLEQQKQADRNSYLKRSEQNKIAIQQAMPRL